MKRALWVWLVCVGVTIVSLPVYYYCLLFTARTLPRLSLHMVHNTITTDLGPHPPHHHQQHQHHHQHQLLFNGSNLIPPLLNNNGPVDQSEHTQHLLENHIGPVENGPVWAAQSLDIGPRGNGPHDENGPEEIWEAKKNRASDVTRKIKPKKPILIKVEIFPNWTTRAPHDAIFTRRVYLYSAIINIHRAPYLTHARSTNRTHIHLVAFQDGHRKNELKCCLSFPERGVVTETGYASIDFSNRRLSDTADSRDTKVGGVVFRCRVPLAVSELSGSYLTLTPGSCPGDVGEYLPVRKPERKVGGLAVCAKVAFGHHLNPYKLVEWVEAQRVLGVDRIQLLECNNSATVHRVLQYYQQIGVLHVMPYTLPGRKWGRGFLAGKHDWIHFGIDTVLPLWDCRLRLAGYDYVMNIDMDEIILARHFFALKPFFKTQFHEHKRAAALEFKVQTFISDWGPVNPKAPLLVLQYLNSTTPMHSTVKYVYLPSRVHQPWTHYVTPYKGFNSPTVPPSKGVIFHYRKCKALWRFSCKSTRRIKDHTMLRYEDILLPNVKKVLSKVGL